MPQGGSAPCGFCIHGEGSAHIEGLFLHSEGGLAAGAARAPEKAGEFRDSHFRSQAAGNHPALVVTPLQKPGPVQGHGDDCIHVGKEGRGGQIFRKHPGQETAGRNVAVILQGLGQPGIGTLGRIIEKSRSVRIRLIFIRAEAGIELVGHRIVFHLGKTCQRQVGKTIPAYMFFFTVKACAAHDAHSRHHQVRNCRQGRFQVQVFR